MDILLRPQNMISIGLLVLAVVFYILYRFRHKQNMRDPEYQKKLEERAAEYRRQKQEEEELASATMEMSQEYVDNEQQ